MYSGEPSGRRWRVRGTYLLSRPSHALFSFCERAAPNGGAPGSGTEEPVAMAGAAVRSELVAGDRSLQPGEMAASVANATSARAAPVRRRAPRGPLAASPR